jgi:HEAT repeat protein
MHCVQQQTDPEVRIAAIGALSAIIDHDAERMLICLMSDGDPLVARAAASALEKSGPRGREALSCVHPATRAGAYAAEVVAIGQLDRSRRVGSSA